MTASSPNLPDLGSLLTDLDTILRRIGELESFTAIQVSRCSAGWQVSAQRQGTNAFKIGVDRRLDVAFRKAICADYGVPDEEWLQTEDWRDLV